ncbi:MAG: hypothetical protein GXY14_08390 [Spirochaetes bacterium]|nr:hypothetical protein [Spirochaetota bacterium]
MKIALRVASRLDDLQVIAITVTGAGWKFRTHKPGRFIVAESPTFAVVRQ